jgi:hypothetical protein
MSTIRIKSTDEATQGPFVIIDADQFDADRHELFGAEPEAESKPQGIAGLRAELTARGIAFDPDAKKADLKALLESADAQQ